MAEIKVAPAAAGAQPGPRVYDLPAQSLRPQIKRDEILRRVLLGEPLVCAEYRGTKLDLVRYMDKKTGKPEQFVKVEHHVEGCISGGPCEAFVVEERQPKEIDDPKKVHIGLVKGQNVALRLSTIRREKGSVSASVDGLDGVMIVVE